MVITDTNKTMSNTYEKQQRRYIYKKHGFETFKLI